MEIKDIHNIGRRDMIAEILMMIRVEDGDTEKVAHQLADILLEHDPEHPHALWVKSNI